MFSFFSCFSMNIKQLNECVINNTGKYCKVRIFGKEGKEVGEYCLGERMIEKII